MNTTVLAWIVGGIVLVGGAYLLVTHNTGKGDSMVKEEDHMMATSSDESMMKEGESTEQAGGDAMMKGDEGVMMSEKGSYESYAPEKLTLAEHGKVVLFFHADWCPICRPLDAAFKAGGIPDGVHVLKVDYDTATDLKKEVWCDLSAHLRAGGCTGQAHHKIR